MSACFKKVCRPDAISSLPDHVIDKILTCLPLKDAARTSILSRQWRYKWVKLSQLVFDAGFAKKQFQSRYKLLMRIFQVLLVHRGPVTKFVLSAPGLESCTEIDQLLLFLSRKGVKEFTLHIVKGKHYQLHSSLFSFAQLTHMNLYGCVFKPPPFQGFSKLVQLSLEEVIIRAETLTTLIEQSHMLEHLTIISSSTLILNGVAPNLKFLQLKAHSYMVCCFHAPLLVNVSFLLKVLRIMEMEASKEEQAYDLENLLFSSPLIQNLELDCYYLKSLVAGGISPDLNLNFLKVLKLSAICFTMANEVACALLLITSSSNLERITLEAFPGQKGSTIQDIRFFEGLAIKETLSFCKVREVEMLNISGSWPELEFIKMLLGRLLLLERMIVEPNLRTVSDGGFKMLKNVSQFQRASPLAVIKFRSP